MNTKLKEIHIKIDKLKKSLNYWSHEYYVNNTSIVDDEYFDQKLLELIKLEKSYPQFKTPDSPTMRVGTNHNLTIFKKEKHIPKSMLSLQNAFSYEELLKFENKIKDTVSNKKIFYSVEAKIDGLSLSLIYENGKLVKALTRGDGNYGEVITKNVLRIATIPKTIAFNEPLNVRGEVYMPNTSFKLLNQEQANENKKLFANPRNAASGTLRQLKSEIVAKRNLAFFAYEALNLKTKHNQWKTQFETLAQLQNLDFQINPLTEKVEGMKAAITEIKKLIENRDNLDYDIDGIVLKVDDFSLQTTLGSTSKFPKWAIAFKFPAQEKSTELLDIFATVGRTGRITYNASLKAVFLAGTVVRRATLHNADYIKKLDLRIGDIVKVKKAGDIIPKVVAVVQHKKGAKKWEPITTCPVCGTKLVKKSGEVDQYCPNKNCKSRFLNTLIHFVSRNAANIIGLSDQQLKKFVDLGWIYNFKDIYLLKEHKNELLKLDGYQEKSIQKLLLAIENSKYLELANFLFALGIQHIGLRTAIDLSKQFKTITDILNTNSEKLLAIPDFGQTKTNSLLEWIKDKKNKQLIADLLLLGIKPKNTYYHMNTTNNSFFKDKIVVVTGTIEGASREAIKTELLKLGANPTSSVSAKTDYLIVGKNPSPNKIKKIAKEKIINVINIKEIINYGK